MAKTRVSHPLTSFRNVKTHLDHLQENIPAEVQSNYAYDGIPCVFLAVDRVYEVGEYEEQVANDQNAGLIEDLSVIRLPLIERLKVHDVHNVKLRGENVDLALESRVIA